MSDLQKQFAKAKLSSFPPVAPSSLNEADEDEETDNFDAGLPNDDDSSSASSASSTGTIIPSSNQRLFARPQGFVLPIEIQLAD